MDVQSYGRADRGMPRTTAGQGDSGPITYRHDSLLMLIGGRKKGSPVREVPTVAGLYEYFYMRCQKNPGLTERILPVHIRNLRLLSGHEVLNHILKRPHPHRTGYVFFNEEHSFSLMVENNVYFIIESYFAPHIVRPCDQAIVVSEAIFHNNPDAEIYIIDRALQLDARSCHFYALECLIELERHCVENGVSLVDVLKRRGLAKTYSHHCRGKTGQGISIALIPPPLCFVPISQVPLHDNSVFEELHSAKRGEGKTLLGKLIKHYPEAASSPVARSVLESRCEASLYYSLSKVRGTGKNTAINTAINHRREKTMRRLAELHGKPIHKRPLMPSGREMPYINPWSGRSHAQEVADMEETARGSR